VDTDTERVRKIGFGDTPIDEEGLAQLARRCLASGSLRVSDTPESADLYMLAVPTPYKRMNREDGVRFEGKREVACANGSQVSGLAPKADLSYVERAAGDVARFLRPGNLVILESTVPPGTTQTLVRKTLEKGSRLVCGHDFYLAHAPERVIPGRIMHEIVANDRIVGGVNAESTERAVQFYSSFVCGDVVGSDAATAELVKLMENTFRDVNIALANEFALICEDLGLDVHRCISLANRHPRVNIHRPGPGVGGHCVAVDPYFIIEVAPHRARITSLARESNLLMPLHVGELIGQACLDAADRGQPIESITLLGVSYKADVADERESPALEVIKLLMREGLSLRIHDPHVASFCCDLREAVRGSDLLVLLTDHTVYHDLLKPGEIIRLMRQPRIVDTRGFFSQQWDAYGFQVVRLGVGGHNRKQVI